VDIVCERGGGGFAEEAERDIPCGGKSRGMRLESSDAETAKPVREGYRGPV
jgi:hypothetical protein